MAKRQLTPGTHLYPVPAVMVTCGPYDAANIITLAWVGTVCSTPPTIGISIRPSRYSHGLIKEQAEFGVNLPPRDLLHDTDYCGMVSGREASKFAQTGLTPIRASVVHTALIAECPVNMECRVTQILSLGSHDLFLGEIVAVHADELVLDDEGNLDLGRCRAFAFGERAYWAISDRLEMYGYSSRE
jgi:flavin reductase (DIM6/NTAB) family NADH-FMN oxidoreductase RutF